MKILFVTLNKIGDLSYGGGQCTTRNYEALKKLGEVDYIAFKKKSTISSFQSLLEGNFPPLRKSDIESIVRKCKEERYNVIFLDNSLLGRIASTLRKRDIECRIVTFFHNVEYDYVGVRMGKSSLKGSIYAEIARKTEAAAAIHSNTLIALTSRDKVRVNELYNASVEFVIPITFNDSVCDRNSNILEHENNLFEKDKKACLIVGSFKRDTIEGVRWFINEVAPNIEAITYIVGKGFEKIKNELEGERVKVIGTVDSLDDFYYSSDFVALPIFSGAGMKVKTAEALMYGKTVFGTNEAFVGYDIPFPECGAVCETAEEFIASINSFVSENRKPNNEHSRELFELLYSTSSSDRAFRKAIVAEILGEF